MSGRFVFERSIAMEWLEWCRLGWVCGPAQTGAKRLAILEGAIFPGEGQGFHYHPAQEEVVFVISGQIEQWLDKEKQILRAGDSVFVPPGIVHAAFNVGESEAKALAIFGPCVGDGIETVDVFNEAPWDSLRPIANIRSGG
jgi:quercetin dioxygenase-like cupin family protein